MLLIYMMWRFIYLHSRDYKAYHIIIQNKLSNSGMVGTVLYSSIIVASRITS